MNKKALVLCVLCAPLLAGCETNRARQERMEMERQQQAQQAEDAKRRAIREAAHARRQAERDERDARFAMLERLLAEKVPCKSAMFTGFASGAAYQWDGELDHGKLLGQFMKNPMRCKVGGYHHGDCTGWYFAKNQSVYVQGVTYDGAVVIGVKVPLEGGILDTWLKTSMDMLSCESAT